MKLLFAILAAVLLAGCTIHYPAELDKLGPPTRDPGRIVEVTYNDVAAVHEACSLYLGEPRRGIVILGCAERFEGLCIIHYQHGSRETRRHELAHCTHGAWHD